MPDVRMGARTGSLPQRKDPRSQARRSLVVFHQAGQTYALPLRDIQEIVPMAALAQSPSLPRMLAGFLNLAGIAIPVVRLSRLLHLPDQPPGLYTPLLILRHSDLPLALMVEKVSLLTEVPEDAILPIREDHSFNGCVTGMATLDGHVLLLLSAERLLLDQEQQSLAELQDREQARLRDLEETRS